MPPRQNTRLEAEPNPFQAHRTGGAAPHRPRPYAYPALFHHTEPTRVKAGPRMQTRFGATDATGRTALLIREFRPLSDPDPSRRPVNSKWCGIPSNRGDRSRSISGRHGCFPRRPPDLVRSDNVASHANSQGCTGLWVLHHRSAADNVCFLSAICLGCCVSRGLDVSINEYRARFTTGVT